MCVSARLKKRRYRNNDQVRLHAFLWQNGKMTDFGTPPGDHLSSAGDINDAGQVVGESCESVTDYPHHCHMFIWQNGSMTNLNTLVRPASPLNLVHWGGINQHGDIAGQAYDGATGAFVPFLATRCDPSGVLPKVCTEGLR